MAGMPEFMYPVLDECPDDVNTLGLCANAWCGLVAGGCILRLGLSHLEVPMTVSDKVLDMLAYAHRGVVREIGAIARLEVLQSLDEAMVARLDQFNVFHATMRVLPGDAGYHVQVLDERSLLGSKIVFFREVCRSP